MILNMRVLVVVVALIGAFAGLGQSAYAFGKHAPKPPKVQRQSKKNSSPYAYLAPKKQKKPTGWYQSTLNGQMVYGTKKK